MNLTHKVSLGSVTEAVMYTCAMYLCTLIVLQCIIYNGWRELVILPIMLLPVGEVKGITMTNVDVNKSMMSCVILRQENESINIWNIRYTSQNVRSSERALFHVYYIYIIYMSRGINYIPYDVESAPPSNTCRCSCPVRSDNGHKMSINSNRETVNR